MEWVETNGFYVRLKGFRDFLMFVLGLVYFKPARVRYRTRFENENYETYCGRLIIIIIIIIVKTQSEKKYIYIY